MSRPDNRERLIIFDNVDRESGVDNADPYAFDVTRYFPGADHGLVLITTRLANLEQLGRSWKLGRLSKEQTGLCFRAGIGAVVVRSQRHGSIALRTQKPSANRFGAASAESEELFRHLDGLPLAIAQASAYLRQSEISVAKYIQLYEQQWKSLMESQDRASAPLRDYPDRSVWTTWTISYGAIQALDPVY